MKSKKALDGVTVIDMTRVLAGPYSSMLLADLGATVIKIEIPNRGDDSRAFAPMVKGESAYYMNLNRNKKGITLNLKNEKGKKLFIEMIKKADILLENFRPGTMEKLGLGYKKLKEINPGLVYGCVSGFGHYGPYKDRAGYDIIGQAMGGLMSTTGWPDGEPTRTGTAMADVLAGLSMTIGVLAAYINKQNTEKGQKVDVALVDSVVSSLEIINQIYLVTGENPKRIGNRYESVYPYDSFKAKDGNLVIACGNDKLFKKLANLMDREELINIPEFKTNQNRVKNHLKLKPIIEEWLIDYNVTDVVETLLNQGIPAGEIYTIDKVINDKHIAEAREMFVDIEHPIAGKMKVTGNHIKLSDTTTEIRSPAPTLGQDNKEIYCNFLNLSEKEYEKLLEENVI